MKFALDRVRVSHQGRVVLEDVGIVFESGTVTAVLGGSGAGKSTLLRLLLGLVWPDRGEVRIDEVRLRPENVLEIRRRIGYVIQDGGLFPHLTAFENLALMPRWLRWSTTDIRARVDALCQLTQLPPDVLVRFPIELSGGQRQRVALMRALMLDPPALLLDEPLGSLDPIVRHELQEDLSRIFARLKTTVIVVTHDVAEAAFLASRIVFVHDGRIAQDGTFAEIRRQPADDYVERFIAAQRHVP